MTPSMRASAMMREWKELNIDGGLDTEQLSILENLVTRTIDAAQRYEAEQSALEVEQAGGDSADYHARRIREFRRDRP